MSYSGLQYGDVTPRVGMFAVTNFLVNAEPELVLEKFANVTKVPKNKGLTVKFRRSVTLDVSPTVLTEGVTPAPTAFEVEDVSVNLSQYGAWMPFTDVIADTHEDPILREMSKEAGKQAATMKEMIIWGVIRAGSNVIRAGGAGSRGAITSPITEEAIYSAIRELKANHAKKITEMLKPGLNVSTQPVNGAFLAVGHTNLERDIRDLNGFIPVQNYSSFKPVSEYEIGAVEEVRFILTPHLEPFYGEGAAVGSTGMLSRDAVNLDIYPLVIFGRNAFGVTPLQGMDSAHLTVKNPTMGVSYEDPLGQRGFVSWKFWYAALILNDTWMIRVECAATAL